MRENVNLCNPLTVYCEKESHDSRLDLRLRSEPHVMVVTASISSRYPRIVFSFLSGKENMLVVQMATCFWNVFFSYELISSPFSGYFRLERHGQMKQNNNLIQCLSLSKWKCLLNGEDLNPARGIIGDMLCSQI
ncbi:hypothetical protein P8452_62798 [Trifolium repens]|nr:hypothetical protein P8452_62798 [Trifolium repens]